MHPTLAAERGALGGDVRRGQAGAAEPGGDAGVEAAGHRVLGHADARAERPHLDLRSRLGRLLGIRPDAHDPDHQVARRGRVEVGSHAPHPGRAGAVRASPGPLSIQPRRRPRRAPPRRARAATSRVGVVERAVAQQRRCGERQPLPGPYDDVPGAALLHHAARDRRHPAGLEPGVGRTEGGMAGERQLSAGCEDPQPVVGRRGVRREQEGRLRQVGPAGEGRHLLLVHPVGVCTTATGLPSRGRWENTST